MRRYVVANLDGEVDGKANAVWRKTLSARGTRRPGQYVFRRHGHWPGCLGGDHERKELRRTASLFRRHDELTLGSTPTESAGVIQYAAGFLCDLWLALVVLSVCFGEIELFCFDPI